MADAARASSAPLLSLLRMDGATCGVQFFYMGKPSFSMGPQTDEVPVDVRLVVEHHFKYGTKDEFQSVAAHAPQHVEFFVQAEKVFAQDDAIDGSGMVVDACKAEQLTDPYGVMHA